MDQLRALNYFIAVAETGNFTEAARRFSVPASSVSRRIADLEQQLGANLFQRSTRVVKLTEVGRNYLKQVRPLVAQLAKPMNRCAPIRRSRWESCELVQWSVSVSSCCCPCWTNLPSVTPRSTWISA